MVYVTFYSTASTMEEAKKIAKTLVEKKLAACVNILPNVNSVYFWKGRMQDESETVLIGKTRKNLMKKIIETIKKKHSYAVPCITFMPIIDGNEDYLKWVDKETKG